MKSVRVTFWGEIGDRLGHERTLMVGADDVTVAEIRAELARADEAGQVLLKPQIRAAVDSVISPDSAQVKPGQEVAFFSVVSGG